MATTPASMTPEAIRARVIAGLCTPIGDVVKASDELHVAWRAFRVEQTTATGMRLGRAASDLEAKVDQYMVLVRDQVLADEEPMAKMLARVRLLEGAARALYDECLTQDSGLPRPALATVKAVLEPSNDFVAPWRPGEPDSVLEADGSRKEVRP